MSEQVLINKDTLVTALAAMNAAMNFYDGDVLGILHNDAIDAMSEIEQVLYNPADQKDQNYDYTSST